MQIVIELTDKEKEMFDNSFKAVFLDVYSMMANKIKNGKILPKGHGRLIDAEQLMNYCQNQIDGHKYADCNVIARFPIVLDAEVENEDSN